MNKSVFVSKFITKILLVIIFCFTIFFVCILAMKSSNMQSLITANKVNYETDSIAVSKSLENNMTSEELIDYFEGFWEDTYDSNIKPSNVKFYQRFNRAYYWWGLRARDSADDAATLEASKPHLLAALFLDYSPDNFNSDISEWAAGGDLDNIYLNDEEYAYQVCDDYVDENGVSQNDKSCDSKNLKDEEYNSRNLISIIAQTIADALAKAQKYLDDKDTIRALGRHLFVYQPSCNLTKTLANGETETTPYEYPTTYSFDEILELIAQIKSIKDIFNIMPEYKDCKGADSHWLKANGGDYTSTEFELNDIVDLCSFYEHLVESDYFENHVHFKSDFALLRSYTKTDQEYLIEASKLKTGLAREIIDIVDLANTDDPVYDTSVSSAGGIYGSYSLSEKLYITLDNVRTDSSGYEIKDGSFPIDQYVEGVLDAEVLGAFYGTAETDSTIYTALQANAIAIRTYALKVTNEGTKSITNGTSNQVFTDKYLTETESKYLAARNAALSTSGQVLTENGQLIMAEYSSFSKNTNYRCEGDLCYTSYQKIGAKNSGTLHTVTAKKSWGLAGGHNRGMSQWGSLYLSSNGYTYQEILANFYSENVVVSNYDYSYKSTDNTTLGEYGVKEAMVVCQLFTSSEYSDIRDLLGDNVTLEIPLRIASTKYQSSHGYNASSSSSDAGNGTWFDRSDGLTGISKCDWDPEKTALLYNCDGDQGYVTSMEDYMKDDKGNYLTESVDEKGNVIYVPTTDPTKRIRIDSSETRTDVYLPSAIVWQWAINTTGISIPTEGGWSAHGSINCVSGFSPSYAWGVLPDSMTYDPKTAGGEVQTEVTSTEVVYSCSGDYSLKGKECCKSDPDFPGIPICIAATETTTVKEEIIYQTSTSSTGLDKSYRYDSKLEAGYDVMEYDDVLYTGLTDEEAIALSTGDGTDFFNASHVDTYLYMYVDDSSTLDPVLQEYYSHTVTNIVQPGSSETSFSGRSLRSADIGVVAASGKTETSGFVNLTKFLEANGFVNIGGMANNAISNVESHHWQLACDYSNNPEFATLATDYCCSGLLKGNPSYSNYENGKSYKTVSNELGGYFSDAWNISFCSGTIIGRELVKAACTIAFATQPACLEQCKVYETDDKGFPELDKSGQQKWHFDFTRTAKGCQFNPAQFGGLTSELRNIGPNGECSCAILGEATT